MMIKKVRISHVYWFSFCLLDVITINMRLDAVEGIHFHMFSVETRQFTKKKLLL
jgi:hypothetical protein